MKRELFSSRSNSSFRIIASRIKPSFLIITILLSAFSACNNPETDTLATIGNRKIMVADFIDHYSTIRQKLNLPDNGQVRKEIFRNMLDEELLLVEAKRRGYDTDNAGKHEHERLRVQETLNGYLEPAVFKMITVSERDLEELFVRMHTRIKARHLYAASRSQADSLFSELQNGKTFEELAKEIFKDPQLRDTGGSLGYFSFDEMDPGFEDAAFALEVGQISRPVRTAQGYSIIQVQDRIARPMLTESEYAKKHPQLEKYWTHRQKKKAAQMYVDSLRQHLDISFNAPVVNELLARIKDAHSSLGPDADEFSHSARLRNKELSYSRLGTWDVETFQTYARFTSDQQKKWIRNRENFEDFIAGIIVRAFILDRAQEAGLHETSEFKQRVQRKMEEYLLKRMEESIAAATIIPEDSLLAFFQQNKDRFIAPPRIQLSEIVVANEAQARDVESRLLKKESFSELAKAFSLQRRSAERGGDIGSYTNQDLGGYARNLCRLEIGEWTGPIAINTNYYFFKCTNKKTKRPKAFSDARPEIVSSLKPFWQKKAKESVLAVIRADIAIESDIEKLNAIRLN